MEKKPEGMTHTHYTQEEEKKMFIKHNKRKFDAKQLTNANTY